MFRKVFGFSLLTVFAVSLVGCASMGTVKQKNNEIQGLKNQVSLLETQVQNKDQEINSLRDALSTKSVGQTSTETTTTVTERTSTKVKSNFSVKDVQKALANAGYDPGKIDGRMGKQTRDALRAFQKANNLTVNGKANKKTWALLGTYLTQKSK